MFPRDFAATVVSAILSGGLVGGAASLRTSKSLAKRNHAEVELLQDKAPAEVDNLVIQGTEQAVLLMQRAMEAAEKRAERAEQRMQMLEDEREEDRRTIEQLQAQLADVQRKAQRAEEAAAAARKSAHELKTQLDAMMKNTHRGTEQP